jgi:RecB family endonuclease NucS
MSPDVRKAVPTKLRALGLTEKWLQERIEEDPSLLGLGDLQLIRRERQQSSGGRLDFLLYDPEQETRYEVEVMLGSLDESHIIRTIEYWDIERQRYPTYDHRAVIVAEEITARFFNIIRLLNRAVPLIALQLTAIPIGNDEIVLQG